MDEKHDIVNLELSAWKNRIESILRKFERIPSGKKAKLMGSIMDLYMLAEELDERIEDLNVYGYDGGDYWSDDVKVNIDEFRSDFTETSGTYMDYDYSG